MNTIKFKDRKWRLHSESDKRLIFHPVDGTGKLFVDWRTAQGLNQRDAAKRLGISQPQLARIEKGSRTCPPELLNKIK